MTTSRLLIIDIRADMNTGHFCTSHFLLILTWYWPAVLFDRNCLTYLKNQKTNSTMLRILMPENRPIIPPATSISSI